LRVKRTGFSARAPSSVSPCGRARRKPRRSWPPSGA
jgi:hypothetical protein